MMLKWFTAFLLTLWTWKEVLCCRSQNKEVGICLHIYLERDFLSLENIVFPSYKHNHRYKRRSDSAVENDAYGRRDWIEGPELTDHCNRLKQVLKCFEDVLVDCDSGKHFFKYRHLLYSLNAAHNFLCLNTHVQKERFLRFLKTIECAEKARREEVSCHRHNVSSIVWNKILRLEIGDEICDSLSTQRSCLLHNGYINQHCGNPQRVQIYANLSNYFLSTWCGHPIPADLREMAMMDSGGTTQHKSSFVLVIIAGLILKLQMKI